MDEEKNSPKINNEVLINDDSKNSPKTARKNSSTIKSDGKNLKKNNEIIIDSKNSCLQNSNNKKFVMTYGITDTKTDNLVMIEDQNYSYKKQESKGDILTSSCDNLVIKSNNLEQNLFIKKDYNNNTKGGKDTRLVTHKKNLTMKNVEIDNSKDLKDQNLPL